LSLSIQWLTKRLKLAELNGGLARYK
jgi:hypothetical protein